jgi:hypothetical protein
MTEAPFSISEEQIQAYKKLIELDPPGWDGAIGEVKSVFPDLAKVNPLNQDQIDKLSATDQIKRFKQLEEYKKPRKVCVEPLSPNLGELVSGANPCKNNFFDNVDISLKNFFNKVTEIDGAGLNLASDMKSVVNEISNASTAFTGQITNALSQGLEGYIKGGLSGIATKTFAEYAASGRPVTAAIAKITKLQEGMVEPSAKMFSGMDCLGSKVSDALKGTIEDLLTGMVKNVINVPTCAVQQFTGAIAGKINKEIDEAMTPLINPISKAFSGMGVGGGLFSVKDFISGGVDTISKASDLFKCGGEDTCVSSNVYKMGVGLRPSRSNQQQQNLIDGALSLGTRMTDGVADKIGDFEEAYGQWSIFGTQVGTPSGLEPCNTTNIFNCGPPQVEFFGGDGSGGAGEVILGKFIDKLDVDDIFGSFSRTASIAGVRITKPGSGYTTAPLIAFTDSCGQGYGAFGRAVIDYNQNSPTFGQIKDVIIISEGENYPVAEYTTGRGGVQELFISKVIVDNPGINYQPSDVIVDDNLKLILKEDGSIAGVDVVKQVPTDILPTINISTNTGSGAVLRPVMSIERSTREERLIQVIDCILPKENYQILETETSIEPEISAETLVETPVETPVGTPVETASATTTTPMQTNVSNTTTTSQPDTSSIPQTDPVDTSSQQETGQSNTPPPSSPPSGGGSSGSSGGYGY